MTSIHAYSDEILVVDDTSASLRLLADILSGAGYRVRLATDGDLALRSAKVHPPALILLDIKMPGMDGYEVCQRLKDDEKTRSIPIIFLSILEDEREKVKAFQVGGVDYINKPIRAEEVLARVNTHLTLRHVQLDLEKRNVELEAARDTLEERVKERSAELEQINRKLERQLEVHLCTLEALRESETEFRRIVDTAAEGIWVLGPDNMTTFVNARMAEMLDYSIEDMIGRPQTDFMFEEDAPDHLSKMENRRQGLSEHYERRFRRKDEQTAWTLASATPVFDADRCYRGSFAMFTDITERKQGEQRLHEKERHSQSLLRLSRRLELAQTFMEVVDAARDEVREIIGYQSLWVFLFSEDKKHAYALLAGGAMSEAVMSETGAATLTIEGDRMLEEIAEAKGIVVVEDARTDPRTDKAMVARMENRTIVNVPIIFMDRHLGSVGTGTFSDEGVHPPTKSQEEYLSALASHMAVTLDRLHLLTERKRGEQERLAHLRFFENMDKVNRAIQGTRDLDSMMNNLLGEVLSIFDCDRAWLFHPCDPDAPAFRVPMEVTKPEYSGAKILNVEIPIPPEMAQNLREALESAGPVTYTAGTKRPVNNVSAEVFGVKAQMMVAVYPKSGKPWVFGIHQCSHPRVWTPEEQRFFLEISWRLADSLTSLLAHRDLRQSERHLRTLVENIPDCISRFDKECRRLFVNPAVEKTVGLPAEDLIGRTMSETGTPGDPLQNAYLEEVIGKTFREGVAQTLEAEWTTGDGIRHFEILSVPEKDENGKAVTVLGIAHDITERKQAEEALRRLNRELQAISSCNQVLMRAVDEQTLLDDVCRIICDEAGYRFAWVGYAEHDDAKTIRPVSTAGFEEGYLAEAKLSWGDTERGRGPSGKTIRSGRSSSIQDFDTDPEVLIWREDALKRGYRSSIALPLKDEDGNIFGSLQIYSTEINVFTPHEIKLLDQLAADLAFGITALRTRAERERVEKALQEERKLFIGGPNVAFLWRAVEGWPVEYVSPNVVEQFGYTQEDFTSGKVSYARIVHPDDLERIAEEGKAYGESGVPCFDQEYRIASADGGYRWVYDFTVVRRDPNGVVTHFRGYISDITARRRAEDIRQARLFLLEYADSHTVDELLTATLDRIEALTGSSIGFYHFIEADQETVFLQNWSTNTLLSMCKAEGKGIHYSIAQAGVWVECVQTRRPVIHNDYASLPNRKGLPEGHAPVSREVVVPVFRAGLITAIVGVGNKALNYDENDVDIVWQLADLSWDIVERKRKEEELRRTAEEWRTTFDSITDMVSVQDADFTLVRVNEAYCKAVGMTREALIGKKCYEIVHGTVCPVAECPHEKTLRTGEASVEEIFEPRLGVYLEASTSPIVGATGTTMGSIHIAKDITNRRLLEKSVRSILEGTSAVVGADFIRNLVFHLASALGLRYALVAAVDEHEERAHTLAVWANGAHVGNFEYDLAGTPCESVLHSGICRYPADVQQLFPRDMLLAELGIESYMGTPLRASDGRLLGLLVVMDDKPMPEAPFVEVLLNIFSARAATELERQSSEQALARLATVVQQAAEHILIVDTERRIQYVNPAFERTLGFARAEIEGQDVVESLKSNARSNAFYPEMREAVTAGAVWTGCVTMRRKDGTPIDEEATISPIRDPNQKLIGYVAVMRDITERLKLEAQLRQAQKMEAIGTLAGGIAHDFNNILTIIGGNLDLAWEDAPPNAESLRESLGQALQATARASDLVKQILAFSRQSQLERKPLFLNPLVKEVAKLLRSSIPAMIQIEALVPAAPIVVCGDLTQLHQVLMNLCTNAYHSMRGGNGTLTIELAVDEAGDLDTSGVAAGSHARLRVRDTGAGMETGILERIFEPFFTTKAQGEGTGLGLSVVHGIVESHGGSIRASSELGKGSTFDVLLPLWHETQPEDKEAPAPEVVHGNGERILLVDDEEGVVSSMRRSLSRLGYRVFGTTSSLNALKKFRDDPGAFDLVITDQTMPHLTGLDMAREMLGLRPACPVILCSGLSEQISEVQIRAQGIAEFLKKPVKKHVLAEIVHRVLHSVQETEAPKG